MRRKQGVVGHCLEQDLNWNAHFQSRTASLLSLVCSRVRILLDIIVFLSYQGRFGLRQARQAMLLLRITQGGAQRIWRSQFQPPTSTSTAGTFEHASYIHNGYSNECELSGKLHPQAFSTSPFVGRACWLIPVGVGVWGRALPAGGTSSSCSSTTVSEDAMRARRL